MNSPFAVAAHIGPACLEMKRLAEKANLTLLAHILDMASLQASKDQLAAMPQQPVEATPENTVRLHAVRGGLAGSKARDALR
ncbi:hypothetical protein JQ557_17795 [Bradyrhizobium sp. U87765 SZCCT0131]|uniref:hypothetical protein n=1 Tax=unclassified Bradyrhizobium TaxID=2631580 RepID=UPI001BA6AB23|nr:MULTISPECIES: hypothetical protein [unclassified Bradyrhizobium]MBR1219866.1 hypothetical protein [Bradyrhizobium sp. U87765 SZCCT0131]MBR1262517.1 hypothetical protein [Bradyrhizobium sp. U87765 SZCCT0134]MBR1308300.1 hypothetical protein [Bradyrhizobium sp. U87765 SZCCT0110]MBR1318299.1 hypothetical protein [Bradyrhizobium sp. U87765 SZCCT0109]MBR1352002.1 hypothetical protein [Bradyrhizobium sp. U87765 SZCCT0048]